jgi:hypothetical protein
VSSRRPGPATTGPCWVRSGVVSGPRPTLYDSFDHADVLFADVSSVVSDFLASGKPYVCINTEGLDAAAFRDANPTAAAAYLLSPDCHEVPEIIELVRGADPMEPDRATLREYLLGADEPRWLTRGQAALDALMVDGPGDRTARAVGADESVLEEVDETVLEEVDDPEHASSSDSPTG